jgi:hypothetical protein
MQRRSRTREHPFAWGCFSIHPSPAGEPAGWKTIMNKNKIKIVFRSIEFLPSPVHSLPAVLINDMTDQPSFSLLPQQLI